MDDSSGIDCPGCGISLTADNAGGYRCYCEKCVDAMPPFPKQQIDENGLVIGGFHVVGTYPNFKWEYQA